MSTKQTFTARLLRWYDQHFLAAASLFLLIFIPLYPKIPLADLIPGYIVRLRLEDILILAIFILWGIQALRRQVRFHRLVTIGVLSYLVFGLLSTLSAIFITQSVPDSSIHIVKMYFHYVRYIQYFSLFFITFSSIRTLTHANTLILSLIPISIVASVYGLGQKYLYWPVYSTMNREFSKGIRLYLTEYARVPSTFGGHYDAAAYIMVVSIILLAIVLFAKQRLLRSLSLVGYLFAFALLILTASRTSFIAYLLGVTALMGLSLLLKSFWWSLWRYLVIITFSLVVMLSFGDLSSRFAQVLGLDQLTSGLKELISRPLAQKPTDGIAVDLEVGTATDTPPSTEDPRLPGDVYEDIPLEQQVASASGEITTVYVSRTYSDNAYKYGLSAAIRFDALWPQAWKGFTANPLLGSGYSTLTKPEKDVFTEAESTDNNFLRALGETGLLGFITFFGTIVMIMFLVLRQLHQLKNPLFVAYSIGFVAGSIGLLMNATYIDVFAASKVAEAYWALAGIALALPFVSSHISKSHDNPKA